MRDIAARFALILVGLVLIITVVEMPRFGSPVKPQDNEVSARYLYSGMEETGALNTVASIILDYRAYDTLGEATVLFISLLAIMVVLGTKGAHPPGKGGDRGE